MPSIGRLTQPEAPAPKPEPPATKPEEQEKPKRTRRAKTDAEGSDDK